MTNYEHYKSEIEKIVRMGRCVAVEEKTGEITSCNQISCSQCRFDSCVCDCDAAALAWADAEYIEPEEVDWSEVAVDTPILVKKLRSHDWSRRYFSHYDNKNGLVCAFNGGKTSWTGQGDWKGWNYAKLAEVK